MWLFFTWEVCEQHLLSGDRISPWEVGASWLQGWSAKGSPGPAVMGRKEILLPVPAHGSDDPVGAEDDSAQCITTFPAF